MLRIENALFRLLPIVISLISFDGLAAQQTRLVEPVATLPILFEENVGQTNPIVNYIVRQPEYIAYFSANEFTTVIGNKKVNPVTGKIINVNPHVLRMNLVNSAQSKPMGKNSKKVKIHQFFSNDKKKWISNIPAFSELVYENVYKGIDMVWTSQGNRLSYRFSVSGNASADVIRMAFKGLKNVSISKDGQLVLMLVDGAVFHAAPKFIEATVDGPKRLKGRFIITRNKQIGFEVFNRTPGRPLVIDPEVDLTSVFVGTNQPGIADQIGDPAAIVKTGFDMDRGESSDVFISGTTLSPEFPATDQSNLQGNSDAFVIHMSSPIAGEPAIVYATYFGGTGFETNAVVSRADAGEIFVGGHTYSDDFPTVGNSFRDSVVGGGAYVAKLDQNGMLVLGTMLGAGPVHFLNDIKYEGIAGNEQESGVYVAGTAEDFSFTINSGDVTPGVVGDHHHGGREGFVAKLSPDLSELRYFMFLGGVSFDTIWGLDVRDRVAYVAGTTSSPTFPVELDFQEPTDSPVEGKQSELVYTGNMLNCRNVPGQGEDCLGGFVTALERDASGFQYSTFFGAHGVDFIRAINIDADNNAVITGGTRSQATDVVQQIFVAKLDSSGRYQRIKLLDGNIGDHGSSVVTDPTNAIHLTGTASLNGLAVGNAPEQTSVSGMSDMFYTRLDGLSLQPTYLTYLGGEGRDIGRAVALQNNCALALGEMNTWLTDPIPSPENPDLALYRLCYGGEIPPALFVKDAVPDTVDPGDEIVFTITIVNGSDTSITANITDIVPPPLEIVSLFTPGCTIDTDSNAVRCEDYTIEQGLDGVTFSVRVPQPLNPCSETLTNVATIQAGDYSLDSPKVININANCGSDAPPTANCGNDIVEPPDEQCDEDSTSCNDMCRNSLPPGEFCEGRTEPCDDGLVCGYIPTQTPNIFHCMIGIPFTDFCLFGEDIGSLTVMPDAACIPPGANVVTVD